MKFNVPRRSPPQPGPILRLDCAEAARAPSHVFPGLFIAFELGLGPQFTV